MNCSICGRKMRKEKLGTYHYTDCGLSKIYLHDIEIFKCSNSYCQEDEIIVPDIEKLHELIALELASQKSKLCPEEIRFLRSYLGFSGVAFARKIGVSAETVTRWEKGLLNMKESSERFLRVLVLSRKGPFRNYDDLERFAILQRRTSRKRSFKMSNKNWIHVNIAA